MYLKRIKLIVLSKREEIFNPHYNVITQKADFHQENPLDYLIYGHVMFLSSLVEYLHRVRH